MRRSCRTTVPSLYSCREGGPAISRRRLPIVVVVFLVLIIPVSVLAQVRRRYTTDYALATPLRGDNNELLRQFVAGVSKSFPHEHASMACLRLGRPLRPHERSHPQPVLLLRAYTRLRVAGIAAVAAGSWWISRSAPCSAASRSMRSIERNDAAWSTFQTGTRRRMRSRVP